MRKVLPIIVIAAAVAAGVYVGYTRVHREREPAITGPTLAVTFLDADHGSGIVIKTPEGQFVVIDPGPESCGRRLVSYLHDAGAKSVVVVVSKPSPGRGGSLGRLVDEINVAKVYTGEMTGSAKSWKRAVEAVRDRRIPVLALSAGSVVRLSPTTMLETLSPPKGMFEGTQSDWDNNSLVTRVSFGNKRFLFASDIRIEAEAHLIQSGAGLESDVLALARCGRSGSTSLELLSRVRPESCVMSVGTGRNRPSKAVLKRIDTKSTGASVYRTDKDGTIRMVTDGHSIVVRTEGTGRG